MTAERRITSKIKRKQLRMNQNTKIKGKEQNLCKMETAEVNPL